MDRRDHKDRKAPASPVRANQEMGKVLRIMNRRMESLRTDNHKKVSRRMENLKVEVPRKGSLRMSLADAILQAVHSKATAINPNLVSRRRISLAVIEMVSVASRLCWTADEKATGEPEAIMLRGNH